MPILESEYWMLVYLCVCVCLCFVLLCVSIYVLLLCVLLCVVLCMCVMSVCFTTYLFFIFMWMCFAWLRQSLTRKMNKFQRFIRSKAYQILLFSQFLSIYFYLIPGRNLRKKLESGKMLSQNISNIFLQYFNVNQKSFL